ncbi:MAG: hypothetical protein ACTHM4_07275, partial [Rhodanobacteraceae bacterium]
ASRHSASSIGGGGRRQGSQSNPLILDSAGWPVRWPRWTARAVRFDEVPRAIPAMCEAEPARPQGCASFAASMLRATRLAKTGM